MNDPRVYVEHIDACIDHISTWAAEGRDVFMTDLRTRAAMIRMLQELSESVRRLDPLLQERYPEFPWREVIGFRNVIVHDYLGLNIERIWEIVVTDVQPLKPIVARMREDLARPRS